MIIENDYNNSSENIFVTLCRETRGDYQEKICKQLYCFSFTKHFIYFNIPRRETRNVSNWKPFLLVMNMLNCCHPLS